MPSPRRMAGEAVLAGLVVVVLHLVLRLSALFATGAYNDDGVYVAIGRSLAAGSGYRLIHLVGAPVAAKFPPGLPAVLAVGWWATGSLAGVRTVIGIVQPAVVGATAGLIWWIGRRRLGAGALPLAVLAVGPLLLDPLIHYLNLALAEPEFILGWAGTLVLAFPFLSEPRESPTRIARSVALGSVLAATALFRTIGVVLIPAVLIAFALRRRWRPFWLTAAAALIPLLAWQALHRHLVAHGSVSTLPDEAAYSQLLPLHAPLGLAGLFASAAWEHAPVYIRSVAASLVTPLPLGVILLAAAGAAVVVGAAHLWRERAALTLSVLGVLAAGVVWPFIQQRFALIVLPFAGLLAAAGLSHVTERLPVRARRLVPVALLAVVLAVGWRQRALRRAGGEAFVTLQRPTRENMSPVWFLATNSRFIYEVAGWVRRHTRPADRLLVDSPAGIFLYTGRQTMQATPAQSELEPLVFEVPGRYLASHIHADEISIVVVGWPGGLATDVRAVVEGCPDVLTPADGRPLGAPGFPRFLRVSGDVTCLERFVGSPGSSGSRPPD